MPQVQRVVKGNARAVAGAANSSQEQFPERLALVLFFGLHGANGWRSTAAAEDGGHHAGDHVADAQDE